MALVRQSHRHPEGEHLALGLEVARRRKEEKEKELRECHFELPSPGLRILADFV